MLPPKTTFAVGGEKYYWKGYTDCFDDSDKLVAQFTPSETGDKTGDLVITEGDEKLHDVAVICSIVLQQRGDARKRAVTRFHLFLISRDL